MKKLLKIIVINIIIACVLFVTIEGLSYWILINKYYKNLEINEVLKNLKYKKVYNITDKNIDTLNFRPIEYGNLHKRPIILFGCSFTYGFGLKDEETFSKKLSDYTDRTVINRGIPGTGVSFLYFQVSNENIRNKIKQSIYPPALKKNNSVAKSKNIINNDVEYIIYTFIQGHLKRNFRYKINPLDKYFNIRYKCVNDKLKRIIIVHPLIHSLHTVTLLNQVYKDIKKYNEKYLELIFIKEFQESVKDIKKYFPNTKIVFFIMPDGQEDIVENERIELFKSELSNTIVINAEDLIPDIRNSKYWLADQHPNAYAWNVIVPKLSKELKINN